VGEGEHAPFAGPHLFPPPEPSPKSRPAGRFPPGAGARSHVFLKAGSSPTKAKSSPTKAGSSPTKANELVTKASELVTKAGSSPSKASSSPTWAKSSPTRANSSPTKADSPLTWASLSPRFWNPGRSCRRDNLFSRFNSLPKLDERRRPAAERGDRVKSEAAGPYPTVGLVAEGNSRPTNCHRSGSDLHQPEKGRGSTNA
jgi:hypothetical protein